MEVETKHWLSQIVPAVSAGLVVGIVNVVFGISLAAMIFAGDTSSYVANGISLILLGGIVSTIFVNMFSSYKGTISLTQDAPAAITAVIAVGITQNMGALPSHDKFITVVATILLASILTGISFILLGQFRLGSLVRFLPYPVVGGFLAGTGWLLIVGGIGVMTDVPFSFTNLSVLIQPDVLARWLPGMVLAFLMLWILNRFNHVLLLPGMLLGTVALFYAVTFVTGTPFSVLSQQGLLLAPFPSSNLLGSLSFENVNQIHWESILAQAGGIASVVMISVVSMLLNASAIELVTRQDYELNHELRVVGMANILNGLLGSSVSYHVLLDTSINVNIGKGQRLTIWVAAIIISLPLVLGTSVLSAIPKMALGVPLILFGLSFLYEWIYESWFKFARLEYAVILLILIISASFGYLQGVGIGILIAVVLFIVNYSRVNIVKHSFSGAEFQSRVTRNLNSRKMLVELGDHAFILQLQGFIFFGTASKLLEQVRKRIEQLELLPLRFLILDFSRVSGLDSTALLSFAKIKQISQTHNITILVAGASPGVIKQFEWGDFISNDSEEVCLYPDLDHGLEWVENQLLDSVGKHRNSPSSLKEMFYQLLPDEALLSGLMGFLEKREVKKDDYLIRQGDQPDNVYFIEQGQVTAQLEYPNQRSVRLETMQAGRVIGEIGFYLGQQRTATVRADEDSTVYLMSSLTLDRIEVTSPQIASYFHQLIIQLLAERATHLIRTVAALEK